MRPNVSVEKTKSLGYIARVGATFIQPFRSTINGPGDNTWPHRGQCVDHHVDRFRIAAGVLYQPAESLDYGGWNGHGDVSSL